MRRVVFMSAGLFLLIVGLILVAALRERFNIPAHAIGFTAGFVSSLSVCLVIYIVRNVRALRSEEKLRKMFIAETDERSVMLLEKSLYITVCLLVFIVSAAALVAVFINVTVAITLVSVLVLLGLLWLVVDTVVRLKY
jgi:hypothetical protein